jgi:hypothetical protein
MPADIRAALIGALAIPAAKRSPAQQQLVREHAKDVELTPDEVQAKFKEYREYARKIAGEIQKEKGKLKLNAARIFVWNCGGTFVQEMFDWGWTFSSASVIVW